MNRNIDIVKGFVIFTVITNHYIGYYISELFYGYANGFIGLFFLVSGYLTSGSLARVTRQRGSIYSYYIKRFFRIYPLYLLYLFLFSIGPDFFSIVPRDFMHPLAWTGLYGAPGHIWFIPALIHCYILAYPAFRIIEHFSLSQACFILMLMFGFIMFLCHIFLPGELIYKSIPLGYLPLFGFGMVLRAHYDKIQQFTPNMGIAIATLYFLAIYLAKHYGFEHLGNYTEAVIGALFITYSCIIFSAFMKLQLSTTKWRFLAALGIYSYGLFLFHYGYFSTLQKLDLITSDILFSAFATIVFFPIFYFASSRLERYTNSLVLPAQNRLINSLDRLPARTA